MKNLPCLLHVTKNILKDKHIDVPDEFLYLYFTNFNLKFNIYFPETYLIPKFDILISRVNTIDLKNDLGIEYTEYILENDSKRWDDVLTAVNNNNNVIVRGINTNLPLNNDSFSQNVPTYIAIHKYNNFSKKIVISTHRFIEEIDLKMLIEFVSNGEKHGAEKNWLGKVNISGLPIFTREYLLDLLLKKFKKEGYANPSKNIMNLKNGLNELCKIENTTLRNIGFKNLSEQFMHPYGPVASRNRLEFVLRLLSNDNYIDPNISLKYRVIYKEWEMLSLMFVKYFFKNNKDLLNRLFNKLDSIQEKEEEAFKLLLNYKRGTEV
ncbi:hypothetical protein PDR89_25725 [Bacillus cereus group sp. Bc002]|uniref:hypothetical protein n=1 Tax=unclassified Bacillus cereus group TaxID=2750818 RepID=UPI0022E49E95|nr:MULTISPECIES: hypothetical protein [unclassified Bacillus cereus group]MDA2139027.1 hypothetical protein [Bacillus cereus group sp. Bc256]MDA2782809.1 hypothetical protein [Bacillus cereus group sp. Bc002]